MGLHASLCYACYLSRVCPLFFVLCILTLHYAVWVKKIKIIGELQRGGKKGEEDLMGGERARGEEEPGKEALLRGAETPAPHCGWRCEVTVRWKGTALQRN